MPPITDVGTVQIGKANNGGDVTLTFDVAPIEGDLVVVEGGNGDNDGAGDIGPSTAGYVERALRQTSDESFSEGVWTKRMGASPDTDVVCQGSGSAQEATVYACHVFRGVDPTTPMDTAPVEVDTGVTSNPDPGAITTVTDGAVVIAFAAWAFQSPASQFPTGYVNTASTGQTDTRRIGVGVATFEKASAGVEDPSAFGGMGSRDSYCWTLALRPASAGGITITLTPASVTASAVALDVSIGRLIQLTPASVVATAVALDIAIARLIQLVPASVIASAVALDIAIARLIQLTPASVVATAVALVVNITATGAGLIRRLKHHHGRTARQAHWRQPT